MSNKPSPGPQYAYAMSGFQAILPQTTEPDRIDPLWSEHQIPAYYERSPVVYVRTPLDDIAKKGFKNDALLNMAKYLPADTLIAGGSVANAVAGEGNPTDVDIFFLSSEAFENMYDLLCNPPEDEEAWSLKGYSPVVKKEELLRDGHTVRYVKFTNPNKDLLPIQLIKMVWFADFEHVIDSFDFSVTQFAISKDEFIFNPLALTDLFKKRICLHKVQFPATSLRRLIKYTNKGYFAGPSVLLQIAEGIKSAVEMSDPALVEYETK